MQIRDEYACVPVIRGGPKDGQLSADVMQMAWRSKEDARDQRVRMTQAGHRLNELAIVHRTVTYSDWEVVPDSDQHP